MKDKNDITQRVMGQIKSGQVSMRPAWHFALLGIISASFLTALTISAAYLTNLVVYKLRQETHGMHGQGFSYFTSNFPWLALLVTIVSFGLLVMVLKRFDFSYRLGRWAVVVAVFVILGVGSALAFTNFNQRVENVGPMRHFYGQNMQSGDNGQRQGQMMKQQNGAHWQDK